MSKVPFNQIQSNIRVPFIRIEVNAGVAPYQSASRLVMFAQKTTTGLAAVGKPVLVTGSEDALFGIGSMASAMYRIARLNGPLQEIWIVPLAEATGATAAAGSMQLNAAKFPLAQPASVVVYVGGLRVVVNITTLMSVTQAATSLAAAINGCFGIQVVAATNATAGMVTLTAVNKGTLGNTIRLETRLNYDDGLAADQLVTLTQLTNGVGDPDISAAIDSLQNGLWDFICSPWTDSASLNLIEAFLIDRWSPYNQRYGLHISAKAGTAGTILAFTATRNSQFTFLMPANNSPMPIYYMAAAVACQSAVHLQAPPELSRPMQEVEILGIRPPKSDGDQWSALQRQSFYYGGASGFFVQSGRIYIDRLVSTYTTDPYGNLDRNWLDINQLAQLMWGLRSIRAYLAAVYPRCALVDDNPNSIANFVTKEDIRNGMVHAYKNCVIAGVFQDADTFEDLLIVDRPADDPDRLDTYLPTEGVNQLRVLAINATSFLRYPQT